MITLLTNRNSHKYNQIKALSITENRNLNKIQNLIIMEKEIEKIPIEEVMEMLKEVGINVDQEDAELIMEFLYNLVGIIIRKCFAEYLD